MLFISPIRDKQEIQDAFSREGLSYQGEPVLFTTDNPTQGESGFFDFVGKELVILRLFAIEAATADAIARAALASFYRRGAQNYSLSITLPASEREVLSELGITGGSIEKLFAQKCHG